MATFDRLTVGQVLYIVTREKAGNTTMRRTAVHPIQVIEIDTVGHRVQASWNGNPPRWYSGDRVKAWRVNKPNPSARA